MPRNMYLLGTLFVFTILFISFFGSFVFIKSFHIPINWELPLYTIVSFVPLAFIVAFATSRHSGIKGRNYFYLLAMTLGGYGMYLFIMSIPLAVLLSIFSFSGMALPLIVPTVFFSIAILAGIIGHIQSWHISVTPYSVIIPNLPSWWHHKTAVLVTDTHFGLIRKDRFAKKITRAISTLSPDIIFHGGDFYDGPDITTTEITRIWKELADRIPIFYTPGNHEQYGNYKTFIDSIKGAGVTVLEDTKTIHKGMQIAGITYRNKSQAIHAATAIDELAIDPSIPSILINHPPSFHDIGERNGISLMLSGHTHNGQFWPGKYVARLIYGTYTFGSKRYKSMQAITSRGVGTAGPPLRLFNPPELVVITFKNKV